MASRKPKKTGKDKKRQAPSQPDQRNVGFGSAPSQLMERKDEEKSSLWLITFTDIMALMLTFFVLMYSMSSPKVEKWEEMTTALNQGLSKFYSAEWQTGPQDTISIEKLDLQEALNLNYLKALVEEIVVGDSRLSDVVVILQKDRLIVSLPHSLLFTPGSAEVQVDGQRALFSLGGMLSRIRNRVEVIGHADPRPIQEQGNRFASNWELSLTRAANVSAALANAGYTRPVNVRGLSSARYQELPAGMAEDQRLSYARRVDIVIMKDDGSSRSFFKWGGSG